jgi:hypothetical protein
MLLVLALLALLAKLDGTWTSTALGLAAGALGLLAYVDCASATSHRAAAASQWRDALDEYVQGSPNTTVLTSAAG